MKKTKLKNILKTTGLVAGLSWTLSSCNNTKQKTLSDNEKQLIVNRVDSILNNNSQYRLSQKILNFGNEEYDSLRALNREIAINCAKQYIKNNIIDANLRGFMLKILESQNAVYDDSEDTEYSEISLPSVRKNNRWFNDLIMYLRNNYTDEQFLNSEFFKVINNDVAYKKFAYNTNKVSVFENVIANSSKQTSDIYGKTWEKCVKEYNSQKQR